MKFINQAMDILYPSTSEDITRELKRIEVAGRTAYLTEPNDTTTEAFIKGIIKRGHESVLEHSLMSVRFTTDRGISHELVGHRIASFTQESTRFCDYSTDKFEQQLTFIVPHTFDTWGFGMQKSFLHYLEEAEQAYLTLRAMGLPAEEARGVLPNALKTTIVVTANFREWRKIFQLRAYVSASNKPHPQMRALIGALYETMSRIIPCVFNIPEIEGAVRV